MVAPFAGAWIEIGKGIPELVNATVAPFAGAWIEMVCMTYSDGSVGSLPSRERGLKSASFWILFASLGRSLRGSVD